jgi:hypothetical protein
MSSQVTRNFATIKNSSILSKFRHNNTKYPENVIKTLTGVLSLKTILKESAIKVRRHPVTAIKASVPAEITELDDSDMACLHLLCIV